MRQRLLIARCLIHEPELLILDEPADGLDPMGRSDLRQILQGLRDDGMTILLSSHILREMDELCDYAAIIQAGKLKAHGPIAQLLRDYDIDQLDYRLEYFGAENHVFECLRRAGVSICAPPPSLHTSSIGGYTFSDSLPCSLRLPTTAIN